MTLVQRQRWQRPGRHLLPGVGRLDLDADQRGHVRGAGPPDGSADGSHAYQYEAVDVAGNSSAIGTCTVSIDTTDPTTTAPGLQTSATTGWRSTAQTVTLDYSDASSGVAVTYYTLDGVQHTYTTPFSVSGQLSHVITYWSVDEAGNLESFHTGYVNIDSTAPTTTATGRPTSATTAGSPVASSSP